MTERPANGQSGQDLSMEDILASIRRLLNEGEISPVQAQRATEAARTQETPQQAEDVLILDSSMMVATDMPNSEQNGPETRVAPAASRSAGLVAPETEAEAASAVSSLVRKLANDRAAQVRSTGPTLEDLVREELRPMLKAWLDENLPPLVERLVRAEIERVVARATQ